MLSLGPKSLNTRAPEGLVPPAKVAVSDVGVVKPICAAATAVVTVARRCRGRTGDEHAFRLAEAVFEPERVAIGEAVPVAFAANSSA